MAIDRRHLLIGGLAAIGSAVGMRAVSADAGRVPAYVTAAKLADGRYGILIIGEDGSVLRQVAVSARGHDIALHPASGRAVAFARRPGTFAVAFEIYQDTVPIVFTAIEGRHFYGHGAFSADGRLLYVTENDIDGARGVVGIYDVVAGYRRDGEMPSHGIGPHEIILLPDGRTLAVANGGLDTVPESGRANLNVETMQPSLDFIDASSGALLAKHTLPASGSRLSIRHIARDALGQVWFGGQWEGDIAEAPELIGAASVDRKLRLIEPRIPLAASLKGYIGSVATDAAGGIVGASAPKAGKILYIDAVSGRVVGETELKDGCGIAGLAAETFAVTSGFGTFRNETPQQQLSSVDLAGIAFDNHLRRINRA